MLSFDAFVSICHLKRKRSFSGFYSRVLDKLEGNSLVLGGCSVSAFGLLGKLSQTVL